MRSGPERSNTGNAFTLIELLITIGILGILASIVILAVNPGKQIDDAHNAERLAEVNAILKAVNQFQINKWRLPMRNEEEVITLTSSEICERHEQAQAFSCAFRGKAYLGELVPDYLAAIPQDPLDTDAWGTGYEIWKDADGRITVRSMVNTDIEVSL